MKLSRVHFSIFCLVCWLMLSSLNPVYAAFRSGAILANFPTQGSANAVALLPDQRHVLVGAAQEGLLVVDVHAAEKPSMITKLSALQQVESILIRGKLAFIANGAAGLAIVDLSQPTALKLIGRLDTSSYAFDVALTPDGRTAFVADNTNGVVVVDVSQPTKPRPLAVIPSSAASAGVALNGNGQTLYIADQADGIQIIDVSKPQAPVHQGHFNPAGHPQRLVVSKDGQWLFAANNEGGLSVHALQVSARSQTNQLPMRNAFAVQLSQDGQSALVADLFSGVAVVDLSNPLNPQVVQRIKTQRAAQGVTVSQDQKTAYIADTQAGLTVIRFR
ncbi:hypothetical protein [uncultured Thiothrix sp.]|uniref:LVIVD repeat-containing protein n=1 Tax=uncultured Thiothrix sp. TaxID=223185 RepID=UPI00261743F1|nr:hypothetical protein [uncultured Thiothrix sp.]